jgi:hypothetical protein
MVEFFVLVLEHPELRRGAFFIATGTYENPLKPSCQENLPAASLLSLIHKEELLLI